jgi:aminomethyltransferase
LTSYDLRALTFGSSAFVPLEGINVHVARGGYTGEDGFEVCLQRVALRLLALTIEQISVPPAHAAFLASALLRPPVQLAGLGARDSLRLEAGMCLYGNDLDEGITPVEAGLSWVIGKDRRTEGSFIGSEKVLDQLKNGPPRRRVGLVVEDAPARRTCFFLSCILLITSLVI